MTHDANKLRKQKKKHEPSKIIKWEPKSFKIPSWSPRESLLAPLAPLLRRPGAAPGLVGAVLEPLGRS